MTTRQEWVAELVVLADKLRSISAIELAKDTDLHQALCVAIHRFETPDAVFIQIEDQMQYPPEWDNLRSAVETENSNVLLSNMWGWVALGRWMDAPLARIHEAGWLEPAFRRLASRVSELDIEPGNLN